MADESGRPHDAAESTLDHMAEEFEELEHDKPHPLRWVIAGLLLVGLVAVIVVAASRPKAPQPVAESGQGERLELREPAQAKLSQSPSFFRWESIAGRHHYVFTLTAEKGEMKPIEKNVKNNNVTLTPADQAALTPGRTYLWRVVAVSETGQTIGSGAARFEL